MLVRGIISYPKSEWLLSTCRCRLRSGSSLTARGFGMDLLQLRFAFMVGPRPESYKERERVNWNEKTQLIWWRKGPKAISFRDQYLPPFPQFGKRWAVPFTFGLGVLRQVLLRFGSLLGLSSCFSEAMLCVVVSGLTFSCIWYFGL